eukprot:COSAG02_NODE_32091_length_522_cov_1.186761_1_plen_20_part_01
MVPCTEGVVVVVCVRVCVCG